MFGDALRARFSAAALTRSFSSLRVQAYRRWSLAQFLSGSGGAAALVAVAWLVVELGGDGLALGIVTASMMLPTLVLGPFAGALVDRFPRRSVLILTAAAQLAVAAALAVLTLGGWVQLWSLFALSLAQGLAFAIDNPARQLLVMDVVGRERMTSAVSMNEVVINGSRVFGPAVAGSLLVFADPGWCFVFNALVFVPSILVLRSLRVGPMSNAAATGARPQVEASAVQTTERAPAPWRFAAGTAPIRSTLLLAVCAAAAFNIPVVMPLMVSDVFGAGGGTYGALAVAFGLGALPGAVFSATGPVMPRSEEVRALAVALALAVVLSAAAPTIAVLFVGTAIVGAMSMWFIARANAFVMLTAPVAIRGRVMGIWAMALPGSTVVTGLAVGALTDFAGPRAAYAAIGVLTAVVALTSWRALRST
ncbi:MFS transporter [Microbacterium sp. KUDC0406]|uniref:MFS transporter n=1 Tax=Microbacterium sp. KUDC0406 TaxID=2909588 RepID=UPI001F23322A|nr:MFS transporter [Microbacterium sp. KUDC0406]UJP10522.1 MFS transporter [Microbacterium sp. KUDC0406]